MNVKLNKIVVATLTGAVLLGFGANAVADSTDDILNALIAKGVLTEEEGALLVKGRELEKDSKTKKPELQFKDGMTIATPDGKHTISLNGRLHADFRSFDYNENDKGANTANASDTFDIRRARIGLKGKVYENYEFEISADLASPSNGNTSSILDVAFLNINYWKPAQLRLGQFKMPMNLEKMTSSNNIDFQERGLENQLAANEDRGAMIWGIPKDGFTYALAVSTGEGAKNRNEGDSRVDDLEWLARGTVNFAQLMDNKDAVLHLGLSGSTTDIAKSSGNLLSGANAIRTEARGVNFLTLPVFVSNSTTVDNSLERNRYGIEAVAAFGPFKLQSEYIKNKFKGDLTATTNVNADVNAWYAEALWLITGEKYADFYKDGAFGAIKPKNNFELGKDGMYGSWELGLRYSSFDASDFNTAALANATGTAAPGVTTRINTTTSTFEVDSWTAGIKFVPNPNSRYMLNYISTDFDTPITVAGKRESDEKAITVRAQYMF